MFTIIFETTFNLLYTLTKFYAFFFLGRFVFNKYKPLFYTITYNVALFFARIKLWLEPLKTDEFEFVDGKKVYMYKYNDVMFYMFTNNFDKNLAKKSIEKRNDIVLVLCDDIDITKDIRKFSYYFDQKKNELQVDWRNILNFLNMESNKTIEIHYNDDDLTSHSFMISDIIDTIFEIDPTVGFTTLKL